MWIFTQYGFFSVTESTRRGDDIQIRARDKSHLQNLKDHFDIVERSPILTTPEADYRFRIVVKRWRWEKLAAELAADIMYSNFKGQCERRGLIRSMIHTLHDVWGLMFAYQRKMNPVDPHAGHPKLFRDAGDPLFDDPFVNEARKAADNTKARDARRKGTKGGKL